jgi:hypothetical protein
MLQVGGHLEGEWTTTTAAAQLADLLVDGDLPLRALAGEIDEIFVFPKERA